VGQGFTSDGIFPIDNPVADEIVTIDGDTGKFVKSSGTKVSDLVGTTTTLKIGGTEQSLASNRAWHWAPSKYHIEIGESVTIPSKHQQAIYEELINEGEVIVDGELIIQI
jgi:hypothetical protein